MGSKQEKEKENFASVHHSQTAKNQEKEKILKAPGGKEDISHPQSHEMSPPSLQKQGNDSLTAREGEAGGVNPEFFIQQKYPVE